MTKMTKRQTIEREHERIEKETGKALPLISVAEVRSLSPRQLKERLLQSLDANEPKTKGKGNLSRSAKAIVTPFANKKEATTFGDKSNPANLALITTKITAKCGCKPYKDVFTFKRWYAQGMAVRKGEKGLRLSTATVFCRHQVDKIS